MIDEWQRLIKQLKVEEAAAAAIEERTTYVQSLPNTPSINSSQEPRRPTSNQGEHFEHCDETQGVSEGPLCEASIDQIGATVPEPIAAKEYNKSTANSSDPQRLHAIVTTCALLAALGVGWIAGSSSREFFDPKSGSTPQQQVSAVRISDSDNAACCSTAERNREGQPSGVKMGHAPSPATRGERGSESAPRAAQLTTSANANLPMARQSTTQPEPARTAVKERTKTSSRSTAVPESRPTTIEGWTLREVSGGTVVLEGPTGIFKASRGDTVPGIGRIDSVVRWGSRWVVATSRGLISTP